jgi:hypothetical protein
MGGVVVVLGFFLLVAFLANLVVKHGRKRAVEKKTEGEIE